MKLGTYILALALCSVLRAGAQTNDARLTPTERATWNQLNQRAAAWPPFSDGLPRRPGPKVKYWSNGRKAVKRGEG